MADIEEHLGVTIDAVGTDVKVESNEFDGKVVYGQKRKAAGALNDVMLNALNTVMSSCLFSFLAACVAGSGYKGHVEQLAPTVKELASLEKQAQTSFLSLKFKKPFMTR